MRSPASLPGDCRSFPKHRDRATCSPRGHLPLVRNPRAAAAGGAARAHGLPSPAGGRAVDLHGRGERGRPGRGRACPSLRWTCMVGVQTSAPSLTNPITLSRSSKPCSHGPAADYGARPWEGLTQSSCVHHMSQNRLAKGQALALGWGRAAHCVPRAHGSPRTCLGGRHPTRIRCLMCAEVGEAAKPVAVPPL